MIDDEQDGRNVSAVADAQAGKLHRRLGPVAVLLLALSSLSPVVSIFGIGGHVLHQAGTGAGPLFLIGICGAGIWAMNYAELGSAFPYAGGDYVGVGRILGGWAAAVTAALWLAILGPWIAYSVQTLTVYAAQLAPNLPPALFTFGGLAAAMGIALMSVRSSVVLTSLFLALEMAAVVIIIVASLHVPARGFDTMALRPVTVIAGALAPVPLAVLATVSVSAVFATVGGNQALAFGEELIEPHRNMGRVVVMACMLGAVCIATPVVLLVLGASDLEGVLGSPAPFTALVSTAIGAWAGPALNACVAIAIFNATIVSIMGGARLFYSLGRDRLFPEALNRFLTQVEPGSGAPRAATWLVGSIGLGCCFLESHVLLIFLTGFFVYGWSLVCLAVLIGRRKQATGGEGFWRAPLYPLTPVLGLAMAAAATVANLADAEAGRPSLITMGMVVLAALVWHRLALSRRPGGWIPRIG